MSIGICGTSINAYLRFANADDDNLDDDGVDWKSGERCKTGGARKILSQDDGDNDDDNEYSDDDKDEVEDDDDDVDAKVDWKKGRDAGWRCVSNPLMAPITASTVCLRELLS